MAFKVTLEGVALDAVIADLAAIAGSTDKVAAACACSVMANVIACAGRWGGNRQLDMMDRATLAGFAPSFYNSTIRVEFGAVRN